MDNKKINIVIFSSGNQQETISKLANKLESKSCNCILWTDLFTRKNNDAKYALLPILLKKIPTFDFAIILATPDDSVHRFRNGVVETFHSMRDNVIFEIGLCVMALGANRTMILQGEGVRLFDDLIGIEGINNNESLLSASALGVKCIEYKSTTAIAYYNMFVKRIIQCLNNEGENKWTLMILVPLYIGDKIFDDISAYYKKEGFVKKTRTMNSGRDLSFYYKEENGIFIVCDIPTSIGASYQMARDILSIEAADLIDTNSEKRFLMKEADMFYLTLKKLLTNDLSSYNKDIILDRMS